VDGLEIVGNNLRWDIRTDHPTTYHVTLSYSSPAPSAAPGTTFSLNFGGQTLTGTASATANERAVAILDLGTLDIEPGKLQPLTLTLTGTRQPLHFFEVNLAPQ
jgi:hypothetical protein